MNHVELYCQSRTICTYVQVLYKHNIFKCIQLKSSVSTEPTVIRRSVATTAASISVVSWSTLHVCAHRSSYVLRLDLSIRRVFHGGKFDRFSFLTSVMEKTVKKICHWQSEIKIYKKGQKGVYA